MTSLTNISQLFKKQAPIIEVTNSMKFGLTLANVRIQVQCIYPGADSRFYSLEGYVDINKKSLSIRDTKV